MLLSHVVRFYSQISHGRERRLSSFSLSSSLSLDMYVFQVMSPAHSFTAYLYPYTIHTAFCSVFSP